MRRPVFPSDIFFFFGLLFCSSSVPFSASSSSLWHGPLRPNLVVLGVRQPCEDGSCIGRSMRSSSRLIGQRRGRVTKGRKREAAVIIPPSPRHRSSSQVHIFHARCPVPCSNVQRYSAGLTWPKPGNAWTMDCRGARGTLLDPLGRDRHSTGLLNQRPA